MPKHTHGPNFGRIVDGCPRCAELATGAPVIQWRNTRRQDDARRVAEIRAHDCAKSKCGPVCTAFDW